ncbi:MAG: RNA polymerase sigma factor [Bacteroidales bacterium]|nr:RNA polymerase sigma factor [Bacteroidales bacterium]
MLQIRPTIKNQDIAGQMTTRDYNDCVDRNADGVYRFILKNLKDEHDAQDVVQNAFEKLWINHNKVAAEKAKSYLFTTAYHTMIDHIRKAKAVGSLEDMPETGSSTLNDYTDIGEILDEALEKLNEIQRSVLLLRDYEGYSYKEIGDITGLNEAQVKVYIYRARTFLKGYLVSPEHIL